MSTKTREGNTVYPPDAPIRASVPAQSRCRDCAHVADACAGLEKMCGTHDGFVVVTWCAGYESDRVER